MKRKWKSLVVGSCSVFGLALLALSATAGGSAVRAGDPSTLQNVAYEPIAKIMLGIEQRVADLETTIAAFADRFSAERVVTRQLCVADADGAQTCITKAQLDALLRTAVQVGHAPAESGITERTAAADQPDAAVAAAMPPAEMPPTIERTEAAGALATVTAATPPPFEKPVAAVEETPMSEMAAATSPAAEQPIAAAAAVAPERATREEEPEHTGSVTSGPPAPESIAAPAELTPVMERTE